MPEAPDLQVFAKNLNTMFAGKRLLQIKVLKANCSKDGEATLQTNLKDSTLTSVYRAGKELRFRFSNTAILGMHLMLHGKLFAFDDKNENKYTLAELHFEGKGLALTDFQAIANIQLNPEEKEGIDALSGDLNVGTLKKALQSRSKIKTRLVDQNVIRGIGNAYVDEILWEAKIAPFSVSNKIPDDKIKDLAIAIRQVLLQAEKDISTQHPGIIAGEIRDFLKIHNAKKTVSPTGAPIQVLKKGGATYFTDEQKLFV
jgi:formamidopyrimidine-DNA glycosylase